MVMARTRGAYRRPAAEPVLNDYATDLSATDLMDVFRACDRFLASVENGTRRTRSKREELRAPFIRKRQFTPDPKLDSLLRYQSLAEFRRDRAKRIREILEIYPERRPEVDPTWGYENQIIEDEERVPSAKPRKRRTKAAKRSRGTVPSHHAGDGTEPPQAILASNTGNGDHDQSNG
jgi:hypothetical protein